MVVISLPATADDARHARAHRRAVDQNRARAALAFAAAIFRAGEFQFVAQHPEQHARRVHHQPVVRLVDDEFHAPILRLPDASSEAIDTPLLAGRHFGNLRCARPPRTSNERPVK